MTKRRYFKDSKSYFKFIEKNKKFIDVLFVKPLGKSIKVVFEKKKEIEPDQIELFEVMAK